MISEKAIYSILIILIFGFIYNNWEQEQKDKEQINGYDLVQKFFLGDRSLQEIAIKKPIIWVHIPYDINARKWESFYSRNTKNLNQDYLYLTLRTIIEKNGNDFQICLINDNSFHKLLPKIPNNLASSPESVRNKIREIALAELLYNYGGILLPVSFIQSKSLINLYNTLDKDSILIGELPNKGTSNYDYYPDSKIMGCLVGCPKMAFYISYLENIYSSNFTDSIDFNNNKDEWFVLNSDNLIVIPSLLLGGKDVYGEKINIDRLLTSTFIDFSNEKYGIYFSNEELLKRTNYNWFVYLNIQEVLNANTQLSKNLLIEQ
tara:strand:+ start:902 stop:1858 length:957 start_codon:yes stop_codon:yes gene_type:complete